MNNDREHVVPRRRAGGMVAAVAGLAVAAASLAAAIPELGAQEAEKSAVFLQPTYSSPIALSRNNQLLWSVNPADNSVSVVGTLTKTVLKKIKVGREPQSVALDPNNKFAFVANAAGSSVSVIRITNPTPSAAFSAVVDKTLTTGAEPWNIVISPNGKRVFVANSGQDTITVINALTQNIIGDIRLRASVCNQQGRHFQPRGLAVSQNNRQLFVTRFLSFTKPGGKGADDEGEEGLVCRIDINTNFDVIAAYKPAGFVTLAARPTGFNIAPGGVPVGGTDSTAFPNQLQSIVLRGSKAYLPNIAASPESPLQFQNSTEAYLNVIGGVGGPTQTDEGALNLHLGAKVPETGKKKLFFANPWGIAFTTQAGPGNAYVISAGSDLLVKLNVDANGLVSFTGGASTTRYIDLNNPLDPATSGANAGKNPQGIAITANGAVAYVANFVSRNISVVDLLNDRVVQVIPTVPLPPPGSGQEQVLVGAEMFFSSRGHFDRPANATISTDERLSQDGWQNCASCHFKGLSDGVVWVFGPGPRKSIPLAINPKHPTIERVLNYSAQRDERQDFELNIRNVSGPGNATAAEDCSAAAPGAPTQSLFDKQHGLLLGDVDINQPPCVINDLFLKPNTGRTQVTVTLPGSTKAWPALDALNQWMRFAVRAPNGPLTDLELPGGVSSALIAEGRGLFVQQHCIACHRGVLWSRSVLDFAPPPDPVTQIFCERNVGNPALPGCAKDPDLTLANPNAGQFLGRFLRNVGSFNRGVAGSGNDFGTNIGGVEKAAAVITGGVLQPQQDALGKDHNVDLVGEGFAVSSLLGIFASPPYGHNGSCETIRCVVGDVKHRTANGRLPDLLGSNLAQFKVTKFVESIDLQTPPFPP